MEKRYNAPVLRALLEYQHLNRDVLGSPTDVQMAGVNPNMFAMVISAIINA
jgi:hypothetical protein